jgi:RNA polymerase sigma factor (sigma-70 family)
MEGHGITDAALEEIIQKAVEDDEDALNWITEGPEIYAALERIIQKAVNDDQGALKLLLYHPWLYQLLNRIADWALRRYQVVHDEHGRDVQDVVSDTIRRKVTTLENRRNICWRVCLSSWCYAIARSHSINYLNRGKSFEENYWDSVTHEHTESKRGEKRIVAPCAPVKSPEEEECEQMEQDSLQKSRESKVHQVVWQVFNSFTPEDVEIVLLWVEGKTIHQTSKKTGIPKSTAGKRLKNLQKSFVKEIEKVVIEEKGELRAKKIGVEQILENRKERRVGLRTLIANSLRAMAQCSHPPFEGV